jgi:adenylate kinase
VVLRLKVDDAALLARVATRFEQEGRTDDNPESFKVRLAAYNAQTAPLLPHYMAQGKLIELDGMGAIDDVARQIDEALEGVKV